MYKMTIMNSMNMDVCYSFVIKIKTVSVYWSNFQFEIMIRLSQILRDKYLLQFENYEDYLDSFITPRDLYHLRSKSISRRIIELGYHTPGSLEKDEFYERVKATRRHLYLLENPYVLCSENIEPDDILLQELALREKANRYGELYTIIFIRYSGKSQSQISAYIDYSHRLKSEDWLPYFKSDKILKPRRTDLSYYDWKTGTSILNDSPNFRPMINGKKGLVFQNVHDSAFITVDPNLDLESDPLRIKIDSDLYKQVILYDHYIEIEEPQ